VPVKENFMFDRSTFGRDFLASIVVFLVALPLCMGIAIASGVPPQLGIATGIIGGLVVGFISGSPLQVSGPAAGLSVIVFELVRDMGLPMLGPILLLAGVIQFAAGRLKLGRWFRAISPAVVYGMLAGIGILIIGSQLYVMVDDKPRANGLQNLLALPDAIRKGAFPQDGQTHHIAALLGLFTLAVLLAWNKFRPQRLKALPGTLLGVVAATALAQVLQLPVKHVTLPADFFGSFALPTSDSFLKLMEPSVLLSALAVAFVASAETLLSAAAVDKMHSGKPANYDKELSAQGVGNALCGLIGALPMTGVIVRSSANVQAGAKTRLSAIFHGVWLLALVALFPGLLAMVPTASLAAVLIFTGYKLVELEHLRKLREYGRFPVVIYAATVLAIVFTDLLTGVMVGLGLSLAKLLYKATQIKVRIQYSAEENIADVYLKGTATFLRLPQIAAALESVPTTTTVHIHVDELYYIDHTCYDLLRSHVRQMEKKGGKAIIAWDALHSRYHMADYQEPASKLDIAA
jgi:MFS superfamily sulfate permease-like transporter